LGRAGWDVTVIEKAPRLRPGGQAVDFRGPAHFRVLDAMGILPRLRELATGGCAMRFLDAKGRTGLYLPEEFAGGALEVLRGDLSRVLVEASAPRAKYLFGHGLESIAAAADHVELRCANGWTGRF